MDPNQLIQNAVDALEALRSVPGMDHTVIDECIQAVSSQVGREEVGESSPPMPETEGALGGGEEPHGGLPTPAPTQPPNSLADASKMVMEHHKKTGELPTTGRRGKHLYKRRGQGKGTAS